MEAELFARTYTLAQQIAEVKLELSKRPGVYDRLIHKGRMSRANAQHRMEALTATLMTLQDLQAEGGGDRWQQTVATRTGDTSRSPSPQPPGR